MSAEETNAAHSLHVRVWQQVLGMDRVLAIALFAAFAFSAYGMSWGRVECWNPDQMALRTLAKGFKPHSYLKPPFHTYLNHAVVLWPIDRIEYLVREISGVRPNLNEARLLASRLLVIGLYLGTVALAYGLARTFYNQQAARVVALLLATSAGFIAYNHFLTADSPLLFWMLLSATFASRILVAQQLRYYLLAGLCTGLATATKYNGLAVGIGLVVAHALALKRWQFKALVADGRLCLGLLMVPVGFIAGNPYAVFDWKKFSSDFVYNYTVTPRYEGQEGVGYLDFAWAFPEIIGWPGALLVTAFVVLSLAALTRGDRDRLATKGFLLFTSILLLYAVKMGAFPRVPTRFVLPVVPFFILMAGAFFTSRLSGRWIYALVVPILIYNCACSLLVGARFNSDPRSGAQTWMEANVPPRSRIESSAGSPHWAKLPRLNAVEIRLDRPRWNLVKPHHAVDVRLPPGNNRLALFSKIFAGERGIIEAAQTQERPPDESFFTLAALQGRNPDYVAIHSFDYPSPIPALNEFFRQLVNGDFPYRVVYDETSARTIPLWGYPREIDFLEGRMMILARRQAP